MKNENQNPSRFRLLPAIVDDYAETAPDKIHSYIYPSARLQDGIKAVTFKTLARAVDRAARWLMSGGDITNKPVAYLGCSDIRSIIFFLACIKTSSVVGLPVS
jgi:acyl-coenzyme A synthetase/AMP-(fatty) acid ligase